MKKILFAIAALTISSLADATIVPPRTHKPLNVAQVDLQRFMGTWYEIAAIPEVFELGCKKTTASYALRPDGQVDILNSCERMKKISSAHGTARVVDRASSAKLSVSFMKNLVSSPLWILDVDENYQWVMEANPNRKNLWILSRTPQLDELTLQKLVNEAASMGFNVSKLKRTTQE